MILVLNCGSQSIKWKVFDEKLKLVKEGKRVIINSDDFKKGLEEELGSLKDLKISIVGHRIVHGGNLFSKPLKITKENLVQLESLNGFAPLHNPYNILGIKICQSIFENILQIAVFDTEFFADLPDYAYTYALPENISKEFGLRRFGFQGTSHEYVAKKAAEKLNKKYNRLKIITCHLGGGASVSAVKNGVAVDTSMGFTPLEGLVMMTRPGNIDAGIVLELAKKFTTEKTKDILNKESGLKGICGKDDMIKILEAVKAGDVKAKLALNVFVYSIKKYIGAYFAILGGCDVLVFTGLVGTGTKDKREYSKIIRKLVCKDLKIINKTKILAIDTDEELAIAQKILKLNNV